MLTLSKKLLYALYFSLVALFIIFVFLVGSFQPLYYFLWVIVIGGFVYRNQGTIQHWLQSLPGSTFIRYLAIGLAAILLEEVLASLSMHLMSYLTTGSWENFFSDVARFWLVNVLALPGFLLAWYLLLHRFTYTPLEIFVLAGIFGLYAEKVHVHLIDYPLISWALIVPTIFTYALLVFLPILSVPETTKPTVGALIRYPTALILPVIFSIPGVVILSIIFSHFPEAFPPFGNFQM